MRILNTRLIGATLLALGLMAGSAFAVDKAERTWKAKCASCHGDDCKGQTKKGQEMGIRDCSTADWNKNWTDEKIKKAIEDGVKEERDGKKKQMDPYKEKLKPEVIDDLVKYMRTLKK
jgi:mono/diheme cytochrome c family protein